jgi:protein gp37
MNRTAIEWTDYTWNPVTGCWGPGGTAEKPNRCFYCYAEKVARRFGNVYAGRGYIPKGFDFFHPAFYPERLGQPAKVKKPSKIFVCSMADLFGDWVPEDWIYKVLATAAFNAPHHTFQFLTKNPKRLKDFNPWPQNCWIGTTVTNQADADERLPWLLQVDASVRFVSHEPLTGSIDLLVCHKNREVLGAHHGIDWAILGAMTGPGAVKSESEWVQGLIDQYRAAGVPLFLKDNLLPFIRGGCQEWPA